MITYVAPKGEEFTVGYYLDDRGGPLVGRIRLVHYEDLEACTRLDAGAWIFGGVDRITPAQRDLADMAWRTLDASGMPVRLLNRPNGVLLRAPLLDRLHEAGVNSFRAIPPSERFSDVAFPVFVREKNAHTGNLTPILRNRAALEWALARLRIRGYHQRDLLVVEFLDTSDEEGLFRKYSSYYIDGTVIPKALRFSTEWMLKARHSFWDAAKVQEQEQWAEQNSWADEIRTVFRMAQIDYGRMDYAVLDGRIQVWEINTNPTIARGTGRNKPEAMKAMKSERAKVSRGFDEAFRAAMLELEPRAWGDLSTPFFPPPALLDRIRDERDAVERDRRKRERRAALLQRFRRLRPSVSRASRTTEQPAASLAR